MKNALLTLGVIALSGCSLSMGGHYLPSGPHPHVQVAVAARAGPVEVMHAAVGNSRPVSDLTRVSLNVGPTFGKFQPTVGAGWAWFRNWGACSSVTGECEHDWVSSLSVGAGLTYRISPARIDGGVQCYDGSAPFSCAATLMMGVDF